MDLTYNEANVAAEVLGARLAGLALSTSDDRLPDSPSSEWCREFIEVYAHYYLLAHGELLGVNRLT